MYYGIKLVNAIPGMPPHRKGIAHGLFIVSN